MTVQPDLCQTCSETTLLVFPRDGSNDCSFSGFITLSTFFPSCQDLAVGLTTRFNTNKQGCKSTKKRDLGLKFLGGNEIVLSILQNSKYKGTDHLCKYSTDEPRQEKTGLRDFGPGPTQTGLYSHRGRLEA